MSRGCMVSSTDLGLFFFGLGLSGGGAGAAPWRDTMDQGFGYGPECGIGEAIGMATGIGMTG